MSQHHSQHIPESQTWSAEIGPILHVAWLRSKNIDSQLFFGGLLRIPVDSCMECHNTLKDLDYMWGQS